MASRREGEAETLNRARAKPLNAVRKLIGVERT